MLGRGKKDFMFIGKIAIILRAIIPDNGIQLVWSEAVQLLPGDKFHPRTFTVS